MQVYGSTELVDAIVSEPGLFFNRKVERFAPHTQHVSLRIAGQPGQMPEIQIPGMLYPDSHTRNSDIRNVVPGCRYTGQRSWWTRFSQSAAASMALPGPYLLVPFFFTSTLFEPLFIY